MLSRARTAEVICNAMLFSCHRIFIRGYHRLVVGVIATQLSAVSEVAEEVADS